MRARSRLAYAVLGAFVAALAVGVPLAGAWQVVLSAQPHVARSYTWTIQKTVDKSSLNLQAGQTATVHYTVTATSTPSADTRSIVGNLAIPTDSPDVDTVQGVQMELANYNDGVVDTFCLVACVPTTPSGTAILPWTCPGLPWALSGPSPTNCKFTYTGPALYTSTQKEIRSRIQFCKSGVCLPFNCPLPMCEQDTSQPPFDFSAPTLDLTDNCVNVTDTFKGALGSPCSTSSSPETFTFTYSRTIGPYTSSQCGDKTVPNTASFTTNTTAATGSASRSVTVHVACSTPCHDVKWWDDKSSDQYHFGDVAGLPVTLGNGPKQITVTSPLVAHVLLAITSPDFPLTINNKIVVLYAELLAAKLNIEAGADGSSVASTIAAADAFLGTHTAFSWSYLSSADKATVTSWDVALDAFNNA